MALAAKRNEQMEAERVEMEATVAECVEDVKKACKSAVVREGATKSEVIIVRDSIKAGFNAASKQLLRSRLQGLGLRVHKITHRTVFVSWGKEDGQRFVVKKGNPSESYDWEIDDWRFAGLSDEKMVDSPGTADPAIHPFIAELVALVHEHQHWLVTTIVEDVKTYCRTVAHIHAATACAVPCRDQMPADVGALKRELELLGLQVHGITGESILISWGDSDESLNQLMADN